MWRIRAALTSMLIGCLAACSTGHIKQTVTVTSHRLPTEAPETTPESVKVDVEATADGGWVEHIDTTLNIKFQVPSDWLIGDEDGWLFANPKPPQDNAVIIFRRLNDKSEVPEALKQLDKNVFPMTNVKYTREAAKESFNGIKATVGEGSGTSKDFNGEQLYFLIALMEVDSHYALMATYIKEEAFDERSPVCGKIIKSITRINE